MSKSKEQPSSELMMEWYGDNVFDDERQLLVDPNAENDEDDDEEEARPAESYRGSTTLRETKIAKS